jgi:hypothetical protein
MSADDRHAASSVQARVVEARVGLMAVDRPPRNFVTHGWRRSIRSCGRLATLR